MQSLVIHCRPGHMFDYEIPEDRLPEIDARFAEAMLTRIVQLDDRP